MDTKKLRQKILDLAIHGKLVPQDPNDEPASVLLERIRKEKEQLIKEGKIKAPKKGKSATDTSHYPKEGPFEVPEGWEWCYLNDIGRWQSGATPSRGVKAYYGGSIPWLKTGDLNDDYIKDIPERITEKAIEETSVKLNPAGSVLIAMYGATIGKVGILTFPATTNQACCACSELCGIENRFLFYFLISHKDEFIRKAGGGAQPNISKEIIINTLIPVPPAKEQRRIVREIDKWLSVLKDIEESKLSIQSGIDACKAKILDLAIHGKLVPQETSDEPAIELLKRINPDFKPSDNLHYQDLIPRGWIRCLLYVVCEILDSWRKPVNSKGREERVKEATRLYPYYGATGQVGFIDNFILDGEYILLGEDGAPFLDRYARKAYTVSGKIWVNNHAHVLKPIINHLYILNYLNAINYRPYITGTTRSKLTQEAMRSIPILVPPLAEQKRITSKIEQLFCVIDGIRDLVKDEE